MFYINAYLLFILLVFSEIFNLNIILIIVEWKFFYFTLGNKFWTTMDKNITLLMLIKKCTNIDKKITLIYVNKKLGWHQLTLAKENHN